MSEIRLHRFDVVPVLEGQHGVGMTEIMYASILGLDLIRDLLEVQIDPLRLQMVADFVGEDQSFAVLRFVTPGFPRIAGPLTLHDLFCITDFQ